MFDTNYVGRIFYNNTQGGVFKISKYVIMCYKPISSLESIPVSIRDCHTLNDRTYAYYNKLSEKYG